MDKKEARTLVERCLPTFPAASLPALSASAITDVKVQRVASLWAGMGSIYNLAITNSAGPEVNIMAKKVQMPGKCDNRGDQRKKDSYDVEAAFYSQGHAQKLIAAGCIVPFPLHVETSRGEGVIICMTRLEAARRSGHSRDACNQAFVLWLARLHATYWGSRADAACAQGPGGGLQPQGCYWHLDTRPDEHRQMSSSGWEGRLKLAAKAIDLRLKADPLQTVCHGDAKGANIMYTSSESGDCVPLVYDLQYCGKAAATKDLAYFFNVDAYPSAAQERRLLEAYHA